MTLPLYCTDACSFIHETWTDHHQLNNSLLVLIYCQNLAVKLLVGGFLAVYWLVGATKFETVQ